MNDYKPSVRTLIVMLASLFAVVLPAICFAGMGYMWVLEHGLKFDTNTKPEGITDRLLVLVITLPIIPVLIAAVFIAGVLWMFVMSRLLSWADIQHFTKQKGPRFPLLSDWLDRLWLRMIGSRTPKLRTDAERR
jgi:hypothetical protein